MKARPSPLSMTVEETLPCATLRMMFEQNSWTSPS
jgi:hypothetical protein